LAVLLGELAPSSFGMALDSGPDSRSCSAMQHNWDDVFLFGNQTYKQELGYA